MTNRYFETVDIGDEIGPLTEIYTGEQVRRFLSIRGRMPQDGRFTNTEEAKKIGLPRVIVPGPMLSGILARVLREWAPNGRLTKLDLVFRRNVWQDWPITTEGVVTDIEERGEGPSVDCDLLMLDQSGERLVTGNATLLLPHQQ